ncbi:MAG: GGDEF domain-containing protein [Patescibacteria group bacterium]|nr:GGDEF domain-containing protein [Patescibacteria group bacterium]
MAITRKTKKQEVVELGVLQDVSIDDSLKIIPQTRDSLVTVLQAKITSLTEENAKLKDRNEQLEALLDRDPLTGAYNRNFLQSTATKIVAERLRTHRSWGVLMIDVDFFKMINDTHGHATGDMMIRAVTDALQNSSREGDFVVRYGGDEFCVLACNVDTETDLTIFAERCRKSVATMITDISDSVTLSIGACFVPTNSSMELQSVIKRADKAVYQAKRGGRNCVKVFCDRRKYKHGCRVDDHNRRES